VYDHVLVSIIVRYFKGYTTPEMKIILDFLNRLNFDFLMRVNLLVILILLPLTAFSQENGGGSNSISASVSITATATVVESIEIATLSNINLGSVTVGALDIFVNPQNDDGAGKLLVSGRPEAMIRVIYIPQRELTRTGGAETLLFNYSLSGNINDNQVNSELIDPSRTDFRLGSDGRFFIWIGGRVDIQNAVFGQYEGEFAIEIEYI
jgi:hypothetical protein